MGQLDEGMVGRIVRYKSGKVKLILNDTPFNLDLGMDPGFVQDVVSIHTNTTERSGKMINLGQVNAKFTAIPDWKHLLETAKHSSSSDS